MDAPQPYRTAAMCNIVAGIFNIIVNGFWAIALLSSCFGAIFIPIPMIVMGLGAWQTWTGIRMNNGERIPNAPMVAMVGAISGFLTASLVSTGLGIFAYLQTNDPDAQAYLQG